MISGKCRRSRLATCKMIIHKYLSLSLNINVVWRELWMYLRISGRMHLRIKVSEVCDRRRIEIELV